MPAALALYLKGLLLLWFDDCLSSADFMLDSAADSWLLEANTSPQLFSKAPLIQALTQSAIPQLLHLLICKQHTGSGCGECPKGDDNGKWACVQHSSTLDNVVLQRRWLQKKAKQDVPSVAGISAQVRDCLHCQPRVCIRLRASAVRMHVVVPRILV